MISLKAMGYSYENVNCIKRRRTWTDISKDYKWGKLIGIDNIRSSLSRLDVEDICSQLSIGVPVKDLILQGYPKHPCQDIKRRRSWRHISDQYTF